jgi:VanZ family protein
VKKLIIEYWTPLVLWLFIIFFFSTDTFSAGETSKVILPVLTFFFPRLSPTELDLWPGVIRKFSYIDEYFIFAFLTYRSLKYDQPDLAQAKLQTIMFVVLAAMLDELHQGFTVSRTASPVDIGYDCLGAVWALWLITTHETRRLRSHSIL